MRYLTSERQVVNAIGVALASTFLIGCSSPGLSSVTPPSSDFDVRDIVALADDSRPLVREFVSDGVLRQVDLSTEGFIFHFSDEAATQGVTVWASTAATPEHWPIKVITSSPLLGHPTTELDLAALIVGPESVSELARDYWSNGDLRSLTLAGDGQRLGWTVFWNLPEGVVSATINATTGQFTPWDAPPAIAAPTAAPG